MIEKDFIYNVIKWIVKRKKIKKDRTVRLPTIYKGGSDNWSSDFIINDSDFIINDIKNQIYDKLKSDLKFEKKSSEYGLISVTFEKMCNDGIRFEKTTYLIYKDKTLYYLPSDKKSLDRDNKINDILK